DPDLPAAVEYVEVGAHPADGGGLLLVSGADRRSRLEVAAARLPVAGLLVSEPPEEEAGWIALAREATLAGAAVVVETPTALSDFGRRAVDRTPHLWWVLSSPYELPLERLPGRPWREVRLSPEMATEDDWQRVAGRPPPPGLKVNREQLRLLALAAEGLDCAPDAALARVVAPHMGSLTVRIQPERTWDDLVLPDDQLAAVKELVARYRHRNLVFGDWGYRAQRSAGIIGLFSGAPGTGKTLAAEIVAGEVGCDLFKLDISSVVSKYIGETEKNLEAIFQAAETGETVLFFDEADALFGKRSEVKDAHDRYANIEVAYLLQRLERHGGLVLLATNMANNLDAAFVRRINVAVTFPLPGEAERRLLWEKSFPPGSPTEGIDYDWLVQWEIAGGLIRNVALTAAFLAAESDTAITMAAVAAALRRELQKSGRLLTAGDFEPYASI
ncbi:MAG: ATP-binding protein, partial [Acidimicrobiales bacterium]